MNCRINLTPACDLAKKVAAGAKKAFAPVCKKLSSIYFEYDLDVNGKAHLTPEQTDCSGNEKNVISTSAKGKIKLTAKDILCLLTFIAVAFSLVKHVFKKMLK